MKERWAALKLVETELNKEFGSTTSIVRLGNKVGLPLPSIDTGFPSVNYDVIQCGGIPRGRIIEILGPESSGKTTLALHLVAMEQKQNKDAICAYEDVEHSLDPTYAAKLGVDVDNLLVSQPDCGEDALTIAERLVESAAVSLIVIDSVSALVPRAELAGDMGDSFMGLQARLMSQAMRKLCGKAQKNGVTLIFINQIREKIGIMFGSPETTSGGRALKFYASLRLDTRRREVIKSGDVEIGHKMEIKAIKNKVGSPKRSVEVNLYYGEGFDVDNDVLEYAQKLGLVQYNKGWYTVGGEKKRRDEVDVAALKAQIEHLKKGKPNGSASK